jgi:uncharacterized SAM-binding protein YcdF (DUF218 family)
VEDVLLVLGFAADGDDPVVRARVDKAAELHAAGAVPQLIVSGCCSMKLERQPEITEAVVMRDELIDRGVPPASILLEEESVDTLGNLYFCKKSLLLPCSWYHVGIVTTPWHWHRTEWLAQKILGPDFEVTGYPSEHPQGWDEREIKKSELRNRTLLNEAQAQLGGITDGDHESVVPHLGKMPPK